MHIKAIEKKAERIFREIGESSWMRGFYLAGGTALAVQIGHRVSVDLDFFSQESFSVKKIRGKLGDIGKLDIRLEDEESLAIIAKGVKMSFIQYPYRLLFPLVLWESHGMLADVRDIACMKLDAIASRGTKRDFIDFYFIAQRYPLADIIAMFRKKYAGFDYNVLHLFKSLVYFDDAEKDALPTMLSPIAWKKVKEYFRREVRVLGEKI